LIKSINAAKKVENGINLRWCGLGCVGLERDRHPVLDTGLGFLPTTAEKESQAPFDAACGVAQDRLSRARDDGGAVCSNKNTFI
jgi:hypothetical protein